jgi:hypothetical protein
MIRTIAMGAALLTLCAILPAPEAKAQDPLSGAIGGAILGGAIGGAVTGRAGGAAAGALIGGATGAMIGAEAQRRDGGYYWWHGRCYFRYPSGEYALVARGYCG